MISQNPVFRPARNKEKGQIEDILEDFQNVDGKSVSMVLSAMLNDLAMTLSDWNRNEDFPLNISVTDHPTFNLVPPRIGRDEIKKDPEGEISRISDEMRLLSESCNYVFKSCAKLVKISDPKLEGCPSEEEKAMAPGHGPVNKIRNILQNRMAKGIVDASEMDDQFLSILKDICVIAIDTLTRQPYAYSLQITNGLGTVIGDDGSAIPGHVISCPPVRKGGKAEIFAAVEAMDKAAKILSEASDRARATIKTMI